MADTSDINRLLEEAYGGEDPRTAFRDPLLQYSREAFQANPWRLPAVKPRGEIRNLPGRPTPELQERIAEGISPVGNMYTPMREAYQAARAGDVGAFLEHAGPLVAGMAVPVPGMKRAASTPKPTMLKLQDLLPYQDKITGDVSELVSSMSRRGFDPEHPVSLMRFGDTGNAIIGEGNARLEAAKRLGITDIPVRVSDWDKQPEQYGNAKPWQAQDKVEQILRQYDDRPQMSTEDILRLYHGGRDIGNAGVLQRGHYGRPGSGQDSGAIFLTPSEKYARQYVKTNEGGLYEARVDPSKERIFDATNPEHIDALMKGYERAHKEGLYDDIKDARRDYQRAVAEIEESIRHGAADWATMSQFVDEIEKAGFTGARFLERPGENINQLADGSFEVSGPPVYSYGMFNDVPVKKVK